MAKKIKFPLKLRNDFPVRTLDELRAHFDINKILGYYIDGKLVSWLQARHYEKEADAVSALDKDDNRLSQSLCNIFGVEPTEAAAIEVQRLAFRQKRLALLRQHSCDQSVLEQEERIAFEQSELDKLISDGLHEIYLCDNSFAIPLDIENTKFIGLGNVEVVVNSDEYIDFESRNVSFQDIKFDARYEDIVQNETPSVLCKRGIEAQEKGDWKGARELFQKAIDKDKNYAEAIYRLAYSLDFDVLGAPVTDLDVHFRQSNGFWGRWKGHTLYHYPGDDPFPNSQQFFSAILRAIDLYHQAAELGHVKAMLRLGQYYNEAAENGKCVRGSEKSLQWYKKAADLGDENAKRMLGNL